jgi:hypothetical protein
MIEGWKMGMDILTADRGKAFTRTVAIGAYRADMRLDARGEFSVSWSPCLPDALCASDLAAYMNERNKLIAEMGVALARSDCVLQPYRHSTWESST